MEFEIQVRCITHDCAVRPAGYEYHFIESGSWYALDLTDTWCERADGEHEYSVSLRRGDETYTLSE